MMKVEIDNANIQGLLKDLQGYEKEAEAAIDKGVYDTARAIETDAKNRVNGMLGSDKHNIHGGAGLIGSIKTKKIQSMERTVGTDKHYAPYIEFGTGDLVFTNFDFDDNAKAVAAQYKGRGIRKVNIKGDSFLNWAAVNQSKKLIDRITKELNKIVR